MKKIMAVITAVLFISSLMLVNGVFAEGAADKAAAPMSDKAKSDTEISKDAKGKSHQAKMHKKGKKGKKSKKSKKSKKKS